MGGLCGLVTEKKLKQASDVRLTSGTRAGTNPQAWRSSLLGLPRQPKLDFLPLAIRHVLPVHRAITPARAAFTGFTLSDDVRCYSCFFYYLKKSVTAQI